MQSTIRIACWWWHIDQTHLHQLMVRSRVFNFQDYKNCYALWGYRFAILKYTLMCWHGHADVGWSHCNTWTMKVTKCFLPVTQILCLRWTLLASVDGRLFDLLCNRFLCVMIMKILTSITWSIWVPVIDWRCGSQIILEVLLWRD